MSKHSDASRVAADRAFEECRQAIMKMSDKQLIESLREIPHRKRVELEKNKYMYIGILAQCVANRFEELTNGKTISG